MFFKMKKVGRKCFSLIELLIVIGIMGALAALILPSFSDFETSAKDTACDYNQAGTLRYLNMFKSANGVYPSGFHTGLDSSNAVLDNLTVAASYNFGTASESTNLTEAMTESLQNAGIVSLAYDKSGLAESLVAGVDDGSGNITGGSVVRAVSTSTDWTEAIDPATGEIDASADEPLTFRGVPISDIAALGAAATTPSEAVGDIAANAIHNFRKDGEPAFKIVPLFVAPTVDWETYYSDGPNDSKVSISLAGKCPWGDDGTARYYIAFFKVYTAANTSDNEVPAAKLLATSCPDCGILEGDLF